ncbi:glycerophosphoryl diester phosphodiesterase [Chitinophaga niabensis]|uniref:glycerophosphoryl diester phosphodiesterase n=1 Tax=Chitinophaga niabensis TaxID=536979 RepID=UPI0031BAB7F8
MIRCLLFAGLLMGTSASAQVSLKSNALQLQWTKNTDGWKINQLAVKNKSTWVTLPAPSGEYTLLYTEKLPDSTFNNNFPERQYHYIIPLWNALIQPVPMNTAGQAVHFYPSDATKSGNGIVFKNHSQQADISAVWQIDPNYPSDIRVKITLTAKQTGYFSLATPTVATIMEKELAWAGIPGYFQSNALEHDFIKANVYMQGIPDKPVIVRERTAATLSPFISAKNNITLAVIPDPGIGRDPWEKNAKTQSTWQLGLSLMNRKALLTPTAYHPVLGEKGSLMQKGDTVSFSFRYTIQYADWYTVYKHAVNDVYRFADFLALKKTSQSLTSRILSMHKYLVDAKTSLWRTEEYKGLTIGAQAYLGGVYGSEKDAMKNSDYGAMWMLANITNDPALKKDRLPYARNFKLQQQDLTPGFFYGAAAGQYYLSKSKRFTEEWGPYVEPIGTTYYVLMDAGNVLLFQPKDSALKHTLQLAADKLLGWMDNNGQWQVAYDHATQAPMFKEVEDLRPTFYGLLIAYKILHNKKYLNAAKKGADWYIKNAVEKGRFLGVCGDTRFVPDFATAQSAQALLELYDVTKEKQYLQAAIQTARLYTTSIYTHPIPTTQEKIVNGVKRQDWEISQAGLSFEHGGTLGSANHRGPILLASHAGMFVRMFTITRDSLFLQMARAAALGRDAFVDKETSVASYYWDVMNKGAGPYPHHAWWQIGWITDYLLAEAEMRSGGQVKFPRGFITPKVGPHQSYGFAPGKVNGVTADLILEEGMLKTTSPYLDYYCAINRQQKKLFFILLNNDDEQLETTIQIPAKADSGVALKIAPYGIKVLEINYK